MRAIGLERLIWKLALTCLALVLTSCGGTSTNDDDNLGNRPSISNLSRSSANIGDEIVISGASFGSTQSGSQASLNGVNFTVTAWSDNSITAVVSAGMSSGIVVVSVGNLSSESGSNAQLFIPTAPGTVPIINALSPDFGRKGQDTVTIIGTGFGSTQGTSKVYFTADQAVSQIEGFIEANVVVQNVGGTDVPQWTNANIKVFVPATAASSSVVFVEVGENRSNQKAFNALKPDSSVNPPSIDSIDPMTGGIGDLITIAGTGFGDTQEGSTITINGKKMDVVFWSDTSISARVPEGAASGNIRVTVGGEFDEFATLFEVGNKPVITSVSPNNVRIGSSLVVRGSNFGFQQGTGQLSVGGNAQTVADTNGAQAGWVNDEILVSALGSVTPDEDGNVAVVVTNGSGLSSNPFNVKITSDLTGFADVNPTAGVQGLTQFNYSVSVVGGSGNYSFQLIPDITNPSKKGNVQSASPFTYIYDAKGLFQGQVLITDKNSGDSVIIDVNSKVLVVGPTEPVITSMGTSDWNQFGQDGPNLFVAYDKAGEESYKLLSFGNETFFHSDRSDHIDNGNKVNGFRRDLKSFAPTGSTPRPLGYRYVDAGGTGSRISLVGLNFGSTAGTLTLASLTANEVVVDSASGNNLVWGDTEIQFDLPANAGKDMSGKILLTTFGGETFTSVDPLVCSTHKLSIQPADGLDPTGPMQFNARDLVPPQIPGKVGNKTYLLWVIQANYIDPFTGSPSSGLVPVVTPFEVSPTSTTISFDMTRLSGNLKVEVVNGADDSEAAIVTGNMISTDGTQHYFYVWSGVLGEGTNQDISNSGVMSEAYAVAMGTPIVTGVVANLVGNPTSGTSPLNVTFNINGSSSGAPGDFTYTLSYGDGTPDDVWSTGLAVPNQPHAYTADGNYTATLTVERMSDSEMGTDNVLITVGGGGGGDGFATFNGTVYLYTSVPPVGGPEPPKNPLGGVEVKIKDAGGAVLGTTTTAGDGKYSFTNIAFSDGGLFNVITTDFEAGTGTWLPGQQFIPVIGWADGHIQAVGDINKVP
jgi:hypothetical protein